MTATFNTVPDAINRDCHSETCTVYLGLHSIVFASKQKAQKEGKEKLEGKKGRKNKQAPI
jgi:hypothetical protein